MTEEIVWPIEPRVTWKKPLCTVLPQTEEWHGREKSSSRMEVEDNEDNEPLDGLYTEEIQGSSRRNNQPDLLVNNIPISLNLIQTQNKM